MTDSTNIPITNEVEAIPVFEYPPRDEHSMGECLGLAEDAVQACDILLAAYASGQIKCETEIPGVGEVVFGGVITEWVRITTTDGPLRDPKGLYRWQQCFCPFLDSKKNAGTPTTLRDTFIYKR